MTSAGRVALGLVGLVLGGLAVSALREATLSTHQTIAASSTVEVVVEVESEGRERNQSESEMIDALFLICRLEVNSDLVGEVEPLPPRPDDDDPLYRAVLQPAMDQTNRRQFRGCLEDWTLDQLLVDVVAFEDIP
ncbi:MAG TPA: hypothetical protein VID94_06850 [Acidimicrobiales bacterium]